MIYEILNQSAEIINTIVASEEFMQENYPQGNYRLVPEVTPEVPAPAWEWLIDLGPFYDRFGAAKMQVLTTTDSGIKAILADLNIRKWVDLKRPDVAQALAYVGSIIPAVTPALQTSILTTPVQDVENLALRKLYFS